MKPLTAAVAGGITGVIISAVCAALVAAFPLGFARSYGSAVFHGMNMAAIIVKPQFTALNLLLGFVYAFITGFVIGGVFIGVYNWVEKKLE